MSTQHNISPVFKQQLRQLMPGLDKVADRMARLRHYVADSMGGGGHNEQERLVKAGDIIAEWKKKGIPQNHLWWMESAGYVMTLGQWWRLQVRALRSKAAKSAKKVSTQKGKRRPRASKKKVLDLGK